MSTSSASLSLLALSFLVACSDDPPGNDPAALVGTWRQIPNQDVGDVPLAERATLTFGADGSFAWVDPSGSRTGTYDADDRDIVGHEPEGDSEVHYVVTADRLLVGAMIRQTSTDTDGVIGEWSGTARSAGSGEVVTITLDLAADGSARYDRDSSDAAQDEQGTGTWSRDVEDLVVAIALTGGGDPETRTLRLKELPGHAIGALLFERL